MLKLLFGVTRYLFRQLDPFNWSSEVLGIVHRANSRGSYTLRCLIGIMSGSGSCGELGN